MADDVGRLQELTPRGTTVCRSCDRSPLVSVLDLGVQPLANEMATSPSMTDPEFPLHLRICPACGLGQVGEYVLPDRIFGQDYPYLSSTSTSWLAHAAAYSTRMRDELGLTAEDLVVEVASNDGYLLEQIGSMGVQTLGIEPAGNVADVARARGVPTISEFFGLDTAKQVVDQHGHPRLVVANNVMAHVPDLQDFVAGLAELTDDRTVVTIENPSFVNLLQHTQFDTVYHEHFSYLTAHAVRHVVGRFGLRLVRVEALPTHGGSNRYWIVQQGSDVTSDDSVEAAISREVAAGLLEPATWEAFAAGARGVIAGLRTWLEEQRSRGRTVAGYGAAAKGNTLLNAAGVRVGDLALVVDESSAKQGRFMPGSHIPVQPPAALSGCDPEVVLVLPWNLVGEIQPLVARIVPRASCWVAVPAMTCLGAAAG